jgi:hypothetical protein
MMVKNPTVTEQTVTGQTMAENSGTGSKVPDPQEGTLDGEKLADKPQKEEPDSDQKEG